MSTKQKSQDKLKLSRNDNSEYKCMVQIIIEETCELMNVVDEASVFRSTSNCAKKLQDIKGFEQ